MATTYTHSQFYQPSVNTQGDQGVVRRTCTIDWVALTGDATYAIAIDDIVKLFTLPAFVKISRAKIDNSVDLDDGSSTLDIDIKITDGASSPITKTLLNGGTATGAAGIVDSDDASQFASGVDGINYVTVNGDFYVYLHAIAAANGDAAASAVSVVTVEYSRTLEGGEGIRDFPSSTPS